VWRHARTGRTSRSGSCSIGQGHETTFAQVVAAALDIDPAAIRIVEGDTAHRQERVILICLYSLQCVVSPTVRK
jgi:CO/xanthine dehydrogenase Mo-binding subunit